MSTHSFHKKKYTNERKVIEEKKNNANSFWNQQIQAQMHERFVLWENSHPLSAKDGQHAQLYACTKARKQRQKYKIKKKIKECVLWRLIAKEILRLMLLCH